MSFDTVEKSVSSARPIELYDFFLENTHYRFTSSEIDKVANGFTWDATACSRENVDQSQQDVTGQVVIVFGSADKSASTFLALFIAGAPETNTQLTIYKYHEGDGAIVTFWSGEVRSVAFRSGRAEILCSNVSSFFTDRGPRMTWGAHCNHVFGDSFCTFPVISKTRVLVVSAIAADGVTITITNLSTGQVDGDYVRGELKKGGYQRRYIGKHTGNVVTLLYPMTGLVIGDSVEVTEGCPHTVTACNSRFNNVVNYGGTPWTPTINPFEHGLKNT